MTHNFYKINEYFKEHEKNIYNGITSAKVLPKQIQKKPHFSSAKDSAIANRHGGFCRLEVNLQLCQTSFFET